MRRSSKVGLLWAILMALSTAELSLCRAGGALTYPPRPGEREFIVDEAKLIAPGDATKIKEICDKLLTEKKVPILVVTIQSLATHGAGGWDLRVYAQNLFNTWGIGFKDWNHGMLLIVSQGDRKVWIELGAAWQHRKDAECQQIVDTHLIPNFKQGKFSEGIVAGVTALDAIARGLEVPTAPRPWWHYALVVGFIGLAIFTIVSLVRRGASGWAWLFWGAIFAVLGVILYNALRSRGGGGGGGWGGGSFGGGFGGGGGAGGSW